MEGPGFSGFFMGLTMPVRTGHDKDHYVISNSSAAIRRPRLSKRFSFPFSLQFS
jgi:hypothetical protein